MDDGEPEDADVDDEPDDDEEVDDAAVELEESFAAEEVVAGTVLAALPEPRESVR